LWTHVDKSVHRLDAPAHPVFPLSVNHSKLSIRSELADARVFSSVKCLTQHVNVEILSRLCCAPSQPNWLQKRCPKPFSGRIDAAIDLDALGHPCSVLSPPRPSSSIPRFHCTNSKFSRSQANLSLMGLAAAAPRKMNSSKRSGEKAARPAKLH
jgi:hypothetical protein